MTAAQNAPARARLHTPLLAGAEARLALAEAVLGAREPGEAARLVLQWLGDHVGMDAALCAAVNEDGTRLEGIDGDGVPHARVRGFSLDLASRDNPLTLALAGREPVLFEAPPPESALHDELCPLGPVAFHAVPLVLDQEGDALGLLLLAGLEDGPGEDLRWASRLLANRLVAWRYGRARQVERRFKRERAQLHAIMDAVTDPILLTDPEGRILLANGHAEALLSVGEEGSEGLRRAVALNNMLFSATLFTAAELTGPARRRELLLVDPTEGRDLLFELLSTTIQDPVAGTGVVSVLRNVNDLRRATQEIEDNYRRLTVAEAESRAERDRLDLIINSVADPILVTDPVGNIVLMNPPAERLFTLDEQSGPEAERRVRANDAVFSSFASNLYAGQSLRWRGELNLVEPKSGTTLPVEALAGKVISRQGAVTAVVTILHDRTEAIEKARLYEQVKRHSDELKARVQEATEELVQQNELLRRQALALEQASAAKSQFLANMSHELRTPLNAILGYAQLLLQGTSGELQPRQREKLERVESNGRNLLAIINNVLDFARIEAGRMPLNVEPFALPALVDEVMAEMEPIIARSRLTVTADVEPGLPEARSDRQKVKQILLNLLSNALKFTPEGFIQVRVSYHPDSDELTAAVADTGIGISPDAQEQIFEAFRQADNSYTRQYGGTGLGLSICKRLAATVGGRITLLSRPGAGSTFTLHLPRRRKRKR